MRLLIMNSAVILKDGMYSAKTLTVDEAREVVQDALKNGREILSFVGYPETAELLSKLLGIEVAVNREETQYKEGDVILVGKLRYRVKNPSEKGSIKPTADDMVFMLVRYAEFGIE